MRIVDKPGQQTYFFGKGIVLASGLCLFASAEISLCLFKVSWFKVHFIVGTGSDSECTLIAVLRLVSGGDCEFVAITCSGGDIQH